MILYVNGDSHSAGAEALNSYCFSEDDPQYSFLGRIPHPDNLKVSYGNQLADLLGYDLYCDAESASSNDRIIRTTRKYLETNTPNLIIIGWSSWEREEWLHDDIYWQVNAGGIGHDWPDAIKQQYKRWIKSVNLKEKQQEQHEKIWRLHTELGNIPHLFFNCFSCFSYPDQKDWGDSYLEPYNMNYTYYHWLEQQGYKTVDPKSFHYGPDAHTAWAEFLRNQLTKVLIESIITQ